ncbi:type VI secretion system tip protein TssI/VgrG [Vibrio sp. SCSIO 43136]|uniref:type VI secretion system Vgr family protein n=1 Tax=Vibrio sp. SCSIO 43136 TaxID=2819101 RepID=UPI002075864C|nr:type VI secretion system tip protein TssI/VgrG [Vibrio sp. SCSIO 43136]USD67520.1 type VI secretion system tip protein VgrG [Vibrio sp. SCSIO 43136]
MEKATQEHNAVQLHTPLGKDALYLTRLELHEGLSIPFNASINCYSHDDVAIKEVLLGQAVSVSVNYREGTERKIKYYHAYVSHIQSLGTRLPSNDLELKCQDYSLTLVSALEFMKYRSNCRVYQGISVGSIIADIFAEYELKVEFELKQSYEEYGYKVQYNESDFEFVHRLMEENGIFYRVEHTPETHKIVLGDSIDSYRLASPPQVVQHSGTFSQPHIDVWSDIHQISSKSVVNAGYDFTNPSTKPFGESSRHMQRFTPGPGEVFNYYAGSENNPRLQAQADIHLEALQCDTTVYSATSNCLGFSAGDRFTLSDSQSAHCIGNKYVITQLSLVATVVNQLGAQKEGVQMVSNSFTCLPREVLFRPTQRMRKPCILGLQTAVVTGEQGDEVYVDRYGRIKVLFHWDRNGKPDDKSSCWIRVAQISAGNGYGAQFTPRVGQEVLVSFLDGDPDQPIVVGSLYNGEQIPPYSLPDNSAHCGIKTQSTKNGDSDSFNELRFEDGLGKERLYLQAQRNFESLTKNDRVDKVVNSQLLDVGKQLDLKVGEQITLVCGGASITLSNNGNIDVSGKSISINGSKITLKAGKIALN